jgi:hypothetical protein
MSEEKKADPKEVEKLLKQKQSEGKMQVPVEEEDFKKLKKDLGVQEETVNSEEEESKNEAPDIEPDNRFNPDNETREEGLFNAIRQELPNFLVEVTEDEKDRYHKAILFDTPFSTTISFPKLQLDIEIKSLTNLEREVMFEALEKKRKDANIQDVGTFLTWVQYFSIALQLVKFNGEKPEGFKPISEELKENRVAALEKIVENTIMKYNTVKTSVLVSAHRAFEEKQAKLASAVLDPNFTIPAGIS